MNAINLLPWRANLRLRARKNLIYALSISMAFGVITLMIGSFYLSYAIEYQVARNDWLKNEIILLDKPAKMVKQLQQSREDWACRIKTIQKWLSIQELTRHLFNDLAPIIPKDVVITKIERKDRNIHLWGYAEFNTGISKFIRNLKKVPWIENPLLTEIKNTSITPTAMNNAFELDFLLTSAE